MIKSLSILMPSYNNSCYDLVKELYKQANNIRNDDFRFEIIVADDGSTDFSFIKQNKRINELPNCRYIVREKNVGRAAIRNVLAHEAKGEYLLFLDSDNSLGTSSFISNYIKQDGSDVICGGLRIEGDETKLLHNLRFLIEKAHEDKRTVKKRNNNRYSHFATCNFMVRRDIMLRIPFDERFHKYGYEDVLWGKQIKKENINIIHIDNPIVFNDFETNEQFISKTDDGIRTLFTFKNELRGYSSIISTADKLKKLRISKLAAKTLRPFIKAMRRNLSGNNPIPQLFNIYKLSVYINME